jgi:hypothetical protein
MRSEPDQALRLARQAARGCCSRLPKAKRSPDAAMSPFEVRALRCVGDGSPDAIKPDHRELLIRMQLARVSGSGLLELTEDGRRRLAAETSRALRVTGHARRAN